MSEQRRSPSRATRGLLPGIAVGAAFVIAGIAGFAVGSVTAAPEPAAATELQPAPSTSPSPSPSSSTPAPLPTPSTDAYVAVLDDSLQTGSETLAEGQSGRSDT